MFDTVIVVWVLLLVLVVVTLFAGVKTVSQGQVWTVERFGAYTRLLQPGLNFVLPYVDRVGRKLNVQEQVVEIPEQSVITRDNATVRWMASSIIGSWNRRRRRTRSPILHSRSIRWR